MAFKSVALVRSYEQIVDQVQEAIATGQYAEGQRLPTERELSESFGVSRSVVREAIRVLNALGLVESRQGSGLYVRNNPLPTVSRALTLSVTPETRSLARLFEFRLVLETASARLAAERRTPNQAGRIEAAAAESAAGVTTFESTGDTKVFSVGDNRFHEAVAAAADNPYLAVTLRAVKGMQTDVIERLLKEIPGSIAIAAGHHQRVAAAIAAGDVAAAETAMAEHIRYTDGEVACLIHPASGSSSITEKGG